MLGDEKSDRSTSEIVDFIARKEQAKSVALIMEGVYRDLVTVQQQQTQHVRGAR